jgi:hydroxyacylglutathione hydrolase
MQIRKIVVGQLDVNCYLVSHGPGSDALVIDPGDEPDKISGFIDADGLRPRYILFTHAHYDHVCAVRELRDRYRAIVMMHPLDRTTYEMTARQCITWGYDPEDFPVPEKTVDDGDTITLGTKSFTVLHTPGHTPGSICLYGDGMLFTGDTLFKGSAGRTDLAGGDAGLLLRSLERLALLPPETRVLCGHDSETTIARELRENPFIPKHREGGGRQ